MHEVDDALIGAGLTIGLPGDERPEADDATLALPRAIGRYRVLESVGSGGMGAVYRCWDPQLGRSIAVKVLHRRVRAAADARARMLKEAQTMAQLSHPNVVPVFDVGLHDGEIFIAMEYVAGRTLKDWVRASPRSPESVLEAFASAGSGLAAAHHGGLVHRDFKPSNVLFGDDGRIRVMDFGLATNPTHGGSVTNMRLPAATTSADDGAASWSGDGGGPLTVTGTVVGTPAYMAPEQHVGRTATSAADQYSFFVALFEALIGRRPFSGDTFEKLGAAKHQGLDASALADLRRLPRRLRGVIVRGLDPDPRRRWPSMDTVVARLQRSSRSTHPGRIAAGCIAIVAVAAVPFANGRATRCDEAASKLDGVWDDERRASMRTAMLGTGADFAAQTWHSTRAAIDAHAGVWVLDAQRLCLAADQARTDPATDRELACLGTRRAELAALVTALSVPDVEVVTRAVGASEMLSGSDRCPEEFRLSRPGPEVAAADRWSAALAEARAARLAGRYDQSRERLLALLDATDSTTAPLRFARLQLELGRAQESTGHTREAEAALREAYFTAVGHDAPGIALDAATGLVYQLGEVQQRHDEAHIWVRHARASLEQLGSPPRQALQLENDVGLLLVREGRLAQGEEVLRGALSRASERFRATDRLTVYLRQSLATTLARQRKDGEALAHFRQVHEARVAVYGERHPLVASSHANIGPSLAKLGWPTRALAHFERAHEITVAALGDAHPNLEGILANIGLARIQLGRFDDGLDALRRARTLRQRSSGADHPATAQLDANIGRALAQLQRYEEALVHWRRAVSVMERRLGGPSHPHVAHVLRGLGRVEVELGLLTDARAHLEQALSVEAAGEPSASVAIARFDLARALWGLGVERERALGLAAQAQTQMKAAIDRGGADMGAAGLAADEALEAVSAWIDARTDA